MSDEPKPVTVFEHEGRLYRSMREFIDADFRVKLRAMLWHQVTGFMGAGNGGQSSQFMMDTVYEQDMLTKADELIDLLKEYKARCAKYQP